MFLFTFLNTKGSYAQQYSHQLSLVSDNDLYVSLSQDRYYTNGLYINYRFVSAKQSRTVEKSIWSLGLAHQMFTPYKATVNYLSQHDRPFAAYLYANINRQLFYRNQSLLKLGIDLGWIGENALGSELQESIHLLYPFKKSTGWKYQIADAVGVNIKATYLHPIKIKAKYHDFYWLSKVKVGTIYTTVSSGCYGRIGLKTLQPITNSIAQGSDLNRTSFTTYSKQELFLYFQSQLNYQFYDATIEGSFLNNKSPVIYTVMPWVWTVEMGIRFTIKRFNLGYSICFHTKKLKNKVVKPNNFYGRLQLHYSF